MESINENEEEKFKIKGFSIISTITQKNGIGKDGKVPWTILKDKFHFKNLINTSKVNCFIMGRNTYFNLPDNHRLISRKKSIIIVVSKKNNETVKKKLFNKDVLIADNLNHALNLLHKNKMVRLAIDKIYVIGGEELYKSAMKHPKLEKIHITLIRDMDENNPIECDKFFPIINLCYFEIERAEPIENENNYKFQFFTYVVKKNILINK